MPFVAAVCSKCGSALEVDSGTDRTTCAYCGTLFINPKAINHASAAHGDVKAIENRLENAEIFLTRHKDYAKAEALFKAIIEDAPGDYRAWWGVVRACTGDLSAETVLRQGCGDAEKYVAGTFNVAPMHERVVLRKQWEALAAPLEKRKNELQMEIDTLAKQNQCLYLIVTHPTKLTSAVPTAFGYVFVFVAVAFIFSGLLDMECLRVLFSVPLIIIYVFFLFIFIVGSHGRKLEYVKKTQEIRDSLPDEERKLFDSKDIDAAREMHEQNEAKIQRLRQELRDYD